MTKFSRTAIAMGVAQTALLYCNAAWAQTAATGAAVPASTAASAPDAASGSKLETVVISGQRAALESAQKIKQNSDEIVDSVVAEDIGKLPDRSVTEVLQRIVGVTIDRSFTGDPTRFSVEGSGVAIRGLTYVRGSLNGRDSLSANGGRSLSFEDVPPELMAGVDVYKNPSAEQIEGGISGLVNLRTAMPFDYKGFKFSGSLQTTHATLKKGKASPSGSFLLSHRWKTGIGDIGVLFNSAYSESGTRTDGLGVNAYYQRTNIVPGQSVWIPKGAQWSTALFERKRRGNYLALQWRPQQSLTTSLTYFKSRYSNDYDDSYLSSQGKFPLNLEVADGVYGPEGNLVSGTLFDTKSEGGGGLPFSAERRIASARNNTADLSWNVQWQAAPAWKVSADVQHITADANRSDLTVSTAVNMARQKLDLTGSLPRILFDEADTAALSDTSKYYWASTMPHLDRSKAQSNAGRIDVTHDFDNPILRDIRMGLRFTDRDSTNQNTTPDWYWQPITPTWRLYQLSQQAYLNDPRFNNSTSINKFDNFFNGKVSVPAVVLPGDNLVRGYPDTFATLHGYADLLCAEKKAQDPKVTCAPPWQAPGFTDDPASINRQSEKTKAFYTQLRFGFDDWRFPVDGSIGIRYVQTDNVASGYTVFKKPTVTIPEGNQVTGVPIPDIPSFQREDRFDSSYSNVLPSLNLRMKLRSDLQLRMALAKAISRPNFDQLQGFTNLVQRTTLENQGSVTNVIRNTFGGTAPGNPLLKPTRSNQFDASAEWYFGRSSSLTGAVFYKDLKDVVVQQVEKFPLQDVNGQTYDFLVMKPANAASAKVKGFEIAHTQYYNFLPSWLSGLGTQLSYTYVDSKRKLNNAVASPYCTNDTPGDLTIRMNGCDTNGQSFGPAPLQGIARHTFNLAFIYDSGPFSARVAYNWRSRTYLGQNFAGLSKGDDGIDTNPNSPTVGAQNLLWALPGWSEPYGQVDASVFYKITDRFTVGLEATNLTDSTFKQSSTQQFGRPGSTWRVTGPRYTAQARFSF